jgi:hypothetical protein
MFEHVEVKEIFTYRWTCPVCKEEAEVRTSIPKLFLSCPICNVSYRRHGITSRTWELLREDNHGDHRRSVHPIHAEAERASSKPNKFEFEEEA